MTPAPGPLRLLAVIAGLLLMGGSAWLGFRVGELRGIAALRSESLHRLDLFGATVVGTIRRLEHVPATVQLNPDVLRLLSAPRGAAQGAPKPPVDSYLRRLNAHLGSLAVFVTDARGLVVASSNTSQADDSLLGEDVSFRSYFLDALSGRVGSHFAIGVGGGQPGYFVSHPVRDGARVIGVATIKISLAPIDETWTMLGAPALLFDANQVVIASSQRAWRTTALAELPLERRVDLQLTRQYNNQRIPRFPLAVDPVPPDEGQVVEASLGGSPRHRPGPPGMLVLGRSIDGMDWRLLMFSDLQGVRSQALGLALMSAVACGFVLLLGLFLLQRHEHQRQRQLARLRLEQVNTELEQKVARRTADLTAAIARLRKEVAERQQAERSLRATQDELVQAAKMAVLGQMATGITHELTQPLGAIRTLSGNALEFLKRGDLQTLSGNLGIIARLADQMGAIIQPLKGFARKTRPQPEATDVAQAMANALFLFDQRLRREQVRVVDRCLPGGPQVWCEANRLEQVLINLIANALDAMAQNGPDRARVLTLETRPLSPAAAVALGAADTPLLQRGAVIIEVGDSGPGLGGRDEAALFEPFFTTKAKGAGLGLGLTISRDIVREFGGALRAGDAPADADAGVGGGALFRIVLPQPPRSDNAGDE
ncbi:MAG: sensor histidine kinase [Burkholderiaceae bacterium]|nr:sensor histidine kinase [Burkholderiaceae bacterium]